MLFAGTISRKAGTKFPKLSVKMDSIQKKFDQKSLFGRKILGQNDQALYFGVIIFFQNNPRIHSFIYSNIRTRL